MIAKRNVSNVRWRHDAGQQVESARAPDLVQQNPNNPQIVNFVTPEVSLVDSPPIASTCSFQFIHAVPSLVDFKVMQTLSARCAAREGSNRHREAALIRRSQSPVSSLSGGT